MNNISFLHLLAFHDALKNYFTTFRFSYILVSDVHVPFVDPTCTGESNEMKRSEPCPLIYPANPEAYNNRKINKYGGMRKMADFEKSVYIYQIMSALSNNLRYKHKAVCISLP
jgi:hypothetical protein